MAGFSVKPCVLRMGQRVVHRVIDGKFGFDVDVAAMHTVLPSWASVGTTLRTLPGGYVVGSDWSSAMKEIEWVHGDLVPIVE